MLRPQARPQILHDFGRCVAVERAQPKRDAEGDEDDAPHAQPQDDLRSASHVHALNLATAMRESCPESSIQTQPGNCQSPTIPPITAARTNAATASCALRTASLF